MFKAGDTVYSIGYDMDCKYVPTVGKFVRWLDESKEITCHDGKVIVQDCVTEFDGCQIIDCSADLSTTPVSV